MTSSRARNSIAGSLLIPRRPWREICAALASESILALPPRRARNRPLRTPAIRAPRRGETIRELTHVEGDVTAVYDQYDMLDEKRAAVAVLGNAITRIVTRR
jgi:hypothetical protein